MSAPPATATASPPAPRELWSHEFLDALALEQCRETARRIQSDPSLIETGSANIRRWKGTTGYSPAELQSLHEWEVLMEQGNLAQLLHALTDDSEEATRMRQSSPFAGILSREVREEITDRLIAEWSDHEQR